MSILKILYYPDQRLRTIADSVSLISDNTIKIIDDMFETMYFQQGIGLAATQVNINQQIIVIDLYKARKQRLILINPIILKKTGTVNITEGCLSIPTIREIIPRSKTTVVQYLDQYGNTLQIKTTDLLSVCIQHEIDHLLGKLFIDYLSPLKIQRIHKKIKKWNKNFLY